MVVRIANPLQAYPYLAMVLLIFAILKGGSKFNDAHKPRNHRRSKSFYSRLSLLNNYQVIVADVFAILQLYQIIF